MTRTILTPDPLRDGQNNPVTMQNDGGVASVANASALTSPHAMVLDGTDLMADSDLGELPLVPGAVVGPGLYLSGRKIWENPTTGDLTAPDPITEADLIAAGFVEFTGGTYPKVVGVKRYEELITTLTGAGTDNTSGNNNPSGGSLGGTFTVPAAGTYTVIHTGTNVGGGAGTGFGIQSTPYVNGDGSALGFELGGSDVFTSNTDRISSGTPSKTYSVTFPSAGDYYVMFFSGGTNATDAHTLEIQGVGVPGSGTKYQVFTLEDGTRYYDNGTVVEITSIPNSWTPCEDPKVVKAYCYDTPTETLVFRQNFDGGANPFASQAEAFEFDPTNPNPATADKFSILNTLEDFRWADGDLRLRIAWSGGTSNDLTIEFIQTSNPVTSGTQTITGYQLVSSTDPVPLFQGLTTSTGGSTYLDGDPSGGWWFASAVFGGGFSSAIPVNQTGSTTGQIVEITAIAETSGKVQVFTLEDGTMYYDNNGTIAVLTSIPASWTPLKAEGLRGAPVADNAALTALEARDYELRKVQADGKEYIFELGAVAGTLADDLATGFWQEQVGLATLASYFCMIEGDQTDWDANGDFVDWGAAKTQERNADGFSTSTDTITTPNKAMELARVELGIDVWNNDNDVVSNTLLVNGVAVAVRSTANAINTEVTTPLNIFWEGPLPANSTIQLVLGSVNSSNSTIRNATAVIRELPSSTVINTNNIPVDLTPVGTPLSPTSQKSHTMQWDGTTLVNTLSHEYEETPNGSFSCNHLTGELIQKAATTSTSSGGETLTFPTAFADDSYSIVGSANNSGSRITLTFGAKTPTQAFVTMWDTGLGSRVAGLFGWMAIGRKP